MDRAVFGTDRPEVIGAVFSEFCEAHLGAPIAEGRFYRVSVAAVLGAALADGREIVVKAQRGGRSARYLETCFRFRKHLVSSGFPCPEPLTGPVRVGGAWIAAEALVEAGARANAHLPEIRRGIARSLVRISEVGRAVEGPEALGRAWFMGLPEGRDFPMPHSPLFDFDRTEDGAAWIRAFARRARAERARPAGERLIGHFDWRAEHLRFEGDRLVASYDWDSLHFELFPVLVGALAPHFTADWQCEEVGIRGARAPTRDEMRAFVSDVEEARGAPFSEEERALLSASCVFSTAYTARCNHALSPNDEAGDGDLRPLLREHGDDILLNGL